MDIEKDLLTRAIRDGQHDLLVGSGVTPELFTSAENAAVYEWINEHTLTYGTPPGVDALKLNYPTYRLSTAAEPAEFYIDQLLRQNRHEAIRMLYAQLADSLERVDVATSTDLVSEAYLKLAATGSVLTDDDFTLSWQKRVKLYRERSANSGVLCGIPTGFRTIDLATQGIQPSQFIVIIGQQKSGKSTLMMKMAQSMNVAGYKILFLSFEMNMEEQAARYDAMGAEINVGRLLTGALTRADFRKLEASMRKAEGGYPFIVSTDAAAATTVSQVAAKIRQHKPDVCFIDGVYLMDDEFGEAPSSNAALVNISRGLAKLVRSSMVPIVASTQALESKINKRLGLTAYATGYTSAFNQDCHVMLGLTQIEGAGNAAQLDVLLSRSGPRVRAMVDWDWETGNFTEQIQTQQEIDEEDRIFNADLQPERSPDSY